MRRTPERNIQIERYFATVSDALQGLAPERRAEILADLRAHLNVREAEGDVGDIERLLAELGDPAELAAEAGGTAPVAPSHDGWAVGAIVLTVMVWPVGLAVAAFSGVWRLRTLVYAGMAPVVGWAAGLLGAFATVAVQGRPQVATCLAGPCTPGHAVTIPGPMMTLPMHGLASGIYIFTLFAVGFGAPIAAAIYLAQTRRHPDARPWLPGGVVAVVGLALALAYWSAHAAVRANVH